MRRVDQRGHGSVVQHRARRVARRRDQQPLQVHARKIRRHRLQAVVKRGGQIDGCKVQRLEDLAVAGITRCPDAHTVPGIKERGKRQDESARRARGDDHTVRVQIDIVPLPVHPRDPLAQRRQPQCDGIAKRALLHRGGQCGAGPFGRARAGLADLHMDDVAALRLGGGGGLHHIHHDKGIDLRSG